VHSVRGSGKRSPQLVRQRLALRSGLSAVRENLFFERVSGGRRYSEKLLLPSKAPGIHRAISAVTTGGTLGCVRVVPLPRRSVAGSKTSHRNRHVEAPESSPLNRSIVSRSAWCSGRPGVATRTSTPRRSLSILGRMSTPPKITAAVTQDTMELPKCSLSLARCRADHAEEPKPRWSFFVSGEERYDPAANRPE
jgi:hypothetical protein